VTRKPFVYSYLSIACLLTAFDARSAFAQEAPTTAPVAVAAAPEDPTVPAPKKAGATTREIASAERFMKMHQDFLKRAAEGKIDLLFLGDSITQGWAGKGKEVWQKNYADRNAANFGIGGDRTQHVLWRVTNGELEGISPKVMVLMIGTNNSARDEPEKIAEAVEKIVKISREKMPGTKVLVLAIFTRTRDTDKRNMPTIKAVNQRIAKLDDGKMVKFLDINAKFEDAEGKVPRETFPDGLHPNEKGYEIWAEAMAPTLDAMMKD
jgi:lysophospholipase L1-like esterase